jgi:hypothetical protein
VSTLTTAIAGAAKKQQTAVAAIQSRGPPRRTAD